MKPLSVVTKVHSGTGYSGEGGDEDEDTIESQRVVISPSPGTSFDIKGLKSLTDAYMVVIVEAKIGDRFIWPDSVIDVGMFKDVHPYFEEALGVITEDEPLELYVKFFGNPSIRPFLNLAVFGEETILDAEEVKRSKEAAERRVGIVHFREFRDWLDKATSLELPNVEHVVASYLAGDDPPAEEISPDALLKAVMAHCEEHGAHGFIEQFLRANFKDPEIVAQGMAAVRQMIQSAESGRPMGGAAGAARNLQRQLQQSQAASAQATAQAAGIVNAPPPWSGRRDATGRPTTGLIPPPNPKGGGVLVPPPKNGPGLAPPRKPADAPRGSRVMKEEKMTCEGWFGNHRVRKDDVIKIFKERTGLFSLHINGVHQDFNLPKPPTFRLTK